MNELLKQIKIVEVIDVHNQWENEEVRSLFSDIMGIKFKAYNKTYSDNVLPVDKVDFFGSHLAVCVEQEGKLKPIVAYKWVSSDQCDYYGEELPCVPLVKKYASKECDSELMGVIQTSHKSNEQISFSYSWAHDFDFVSKLSTEEKELIKALTITIGIGHCKAHNIDLALTCGVKKVKTDILFEKMGMDYVSESPVFKHPGVGYEEAVMFQVRDFSFLGLKTFKQFKSLWDERIVFDGRISVKDYMKKAA